MLHTYCLERDIRGSKIIFFDVFATSTTWNRPPPKNPPLKQNTFTHMLATSKKVCFNWVSWMWFDRIVCFTTVFYLRVFWSIREAVFHLGFCKRTFENPLCLLLYWKHTYQISRVAGHGISKSLMKHMFLKTISRPQVKNACKNNGLEEPGLQKPYWNTY